MFLPNLNSLATLAILPDKIHRNNSKQKFMKKELCLFLIIAYTTNYNSTISYFGTIIRTGITCKKIPCICATQLASGFLLKKLKYFEGMPSIFEFSRCKKMYRFLIGLGK